MSPFKAPLSWLAPISTLSKCSFNSCWGEFHYLRGKTLPESFTLAGCLPKYFCWRNHRQKMASSFQETCFLNWTRSCFPKLVICVHFHFYAWSGLMLSGFARVGAVLGDKAVLERAERAACFLQEHLWDEEGQRILHSCYRGNNMEVEQV